MDKPNNFLKKCCEICEAWNGPDHDYAECDGCGAKRLSEENEVLRKEIGKLKLDNRHGVTMMEPINTLHILKRLAAYEDAAPLEKVRQWAQAENDGRLVVLPCKEGDTFWAINGWSSNKTITEATVQNVRYLNSTWQVELHSASGGRYYRCGISAFATREEAEAALRKEHENG